MFNNNEQPRQTNWWEKKAGIVKAFIIIIPLGLLLWGSDAIWPWFPGTHSDKSKNVDKSTLTKDVVNEKGKTEMLPVPNVNNLEPADVSERGEVRLMNWIWFGNAGIFAANGGLTTQYNSLMDKRGLNLRMITNNSVDDMKREQLKFIDEFHGGNNFPNSGVAFVTIMGDGAPAYISAMNAQIVEAFGKEYQLKIIGMVGFSMGEDCLMGPQEWKDNPQSMKGAIISTVIGDGDWVIAVRYASDNGIKINPDPDTYDPEAVNFVAAPDGDFMKAAEDLIAGREVTLKVKDSKGALTNDSKSFKIQGAATWFPADKKIVENTNCVKIISTAQYSNQMATVIVGCDKWCKANSQWVVDFLSASLTASNQIKEYQEWFKYACALAPKVFCANPEDCSESAADWERYAIPSDGKSKGGKMKNRDNVSVLIGGTQMANYNDNKKYFALGNKGNNYYESVYKYSSRLVEELNPGRFMDNVKKLTPYSEVFDDSYLKKVNIQSAPVEKVEYVNNQGEEIGAKDWTIEFESGSARVTSQGETALKELFDLLNISERAKVEIIGHTDDQGDAQSNMELSKRRANAVKQWLIERSKNTFPSNRFTVDGKGEEEPKVKGTSSDARRQNRRVFIRLTQ